MIDFHAHIIPAIDDGARSIAETFDILDEAKKAGFNGIISTSHYIEDYYEVYQKERKDWIEALSHGIEKQKLGIKLYLGSEIYFSENMIELLHNNKASTINDTRYVLFELSRVAKVVNIDDMIDSLFEFNYIPILAHPERYTFVQDNPELVYKLRERGVLMQSNYGSLLGVYGKRAQVIVEKMLENNLVDFLGSDVHRPDSIYPKIKMATVKLKTMIDDDTFNAITNDNALKILNNEDLPKPKAGKEPKPIKLTFSDKVRLGI